MKNRNILISGASVAGPALAYWLRRYGFNPTVVERAPARRDGGYKIDLRGAAVDVADRMGILAEVRRSSTDMRGASYVNGASKRVATMSAELFGGRQDDDVEVMRGDLSRILHASTRDTEYVFDDSITAIVQDGDGVRVSFERGRPRVFDLVVGADGLHSGVRALAFGEESRFLRHLGHYVSIFTIPNQLGLDRWELLYAAPGRTTNVYSTAQDRGAKALFMFASPPLRYHHHDTHRQKQLLTEAFAGGHGRSPGCSRRCGTPPTSISTRSARSTWTAGRTGGWRWLATPATAPRQRRARAPASRWSARTSWPASWRPAAATTR